MEVYLMIILGMFFSFLHKNICFRGEIRKQTNIVRLKTVPYLATLNPR